eukprot:gene6796-10962_t
MSKVEEENVVDCYSYVCEDEIFQTLVTEKSDNTSLILSDIFRMQMPTYFIQPVSLLEKFSTYCSQSPFTKGLSSKDDLSKLLELCGHFTSKVVFTNRKGVECSKPYNPVLGEVFKCSWKHPEDDSMTEFISEQVSHHPPKSAFRSINKDRNILFEGWYEPSTSFKMNYITFEFVGNFTLTLLDTKEVFNITFPNTSACGLLWGKSYYELGGKLIIEKPKDDLKLEMTIEGNKSKGNVYKKKELLGKIYGKLNEQITFTESKTKKEKVIFELKSIKKEQIIVEELKKLEENESRKVWHPVTKQIHLQNGEKATEEKLKIEQIQRDKRNELEEKGEHHKPKYFKEKDNNWVLI